MSNEKFRDLKIGDKIFVYCHKEYAKIVECTVTEIKGSVTYPNLTLREITIDSMGINFIIPKNRTQKENQGFYINLKEEKSRRGENYTGFITIEDALEFAEFLKDQKIEELQNEIKRAEETYNKLLISFEK
jgi:hypothetical protein